MTESIRFEDLSERFGPQIAAGVAVLELDANGKILRGTDAASEVIGHAAVKIGHIFEETDSFAIAAEDREKFREQLQSTLTDGGVKRGEIKFLSGGKTGWLQVSCSQIRGRNKTDPAVCCFLTDVTATKQTVLLHEECSKLLAQISQGAQLSPTLESLVCAMERVQPEMLGSILLVTDDQKHLRLASAPSLPAKYNAAVDGIPIGEGVGSCGTAAYRGECVIAEDIRTHPFWADYQGAVAESGMSACWSHPILSPHGGVLGKFAMYYREPRTPNDEALQVIQTAAYVASIAIERHRIERDLQVAYSALEKKVEQRTSELRQVQSELLALSEQESRQMGRDLHDVVGQELTGAGLLADALQHRLAGQDPAAGRLASDLSDGITRAQKAVRAIAKGLFPVEIDADGLQSAIAELAERMNDLWSGQIYFRSKQSVRVTDCQAATQVYAIAQEAISNAVKHSGSRQVFVSLERSKDSMTLTVADDGCGFDSCQDFPGSGLHIMRYRAKLLGATLNIRRDDTGGTILQCSLPLGLPG